MNQAAWVNLTTKVKGLLCLTASRITRVQPFLALCFRVSQATAKMKPDVLKFESAIMNSITPQRPNRSADFNFRAGGLTKRALRSRSRHRLSLPSPTEARLFSVGTECHRLCMYKPSRNLPEEKCRIDGDSLKIQNI